MTFTATVDCVRELLAHHRLPTWTPLDYIKGFVLLESRHRASCETWLVPGLTYFTFTFIPTFFKTYHYLLTMMLLWSTIIATLVGLASATVIPRDSGFHTLSQDQISSTNPYAYYSAAVKCNPQSLPYWNCGGAYLTCGPFFFAMHDEPVLTHRSL